MVFLLLLNILLIKNIQERLVICIVFTQKKHEKQMAEKQSFTQKNFNLIGKELDVYLTLSSAQIQFDLSECKSRRRSELFDFFVPRFYRIKNLMAVL